MSADPDIARAANITGPRGGAAELKTVTLLGTGVTLGSTANIRKLAAITTDGTSHAIDLLAWFGPMYKREFLRLVCDQTLYYFYSDVSTDTASSTAKNDVGAAGIQGSATGTVAQQTDMLPANTPREEKAAGRYLTCVAAAGILRISIVSPPAEIPANYTGT